MLGDYLTPQTWLMLGDCLDRMKAIPDGSVDMVMADPPYGTTACKWDAVIPLPEMWAHLKRIVKPNGAIVMTASQPFTTALGASNIESLRYAWVWQKSRPTGHLNAKKMPLRDVEDVLVFYGALPTYNPQGTVTGVFNNGSPAKGRGRGGQQYGAQVHVKEPAKVGNYPRQILKFSSVTGTVHPTQKPVALMEYLIKTYTNEGELVLDFTMGSGTTGVACANTRRRFFGIELDAEYFAIASERIAAAQVAAMLGGAT